MLLKDILVYETVSIRDVLRKLDKTAKKVLLVINNENRLLGTITDGDIRHYILSGKSLECNIKEVYNKNPFYLKKKDFSIDSAKEILIKNKIGLFPILDEKNKVIDFITWDQIFSGGEISIAAKNKINIPVVIMAGGKGTRLDPFTRILPKPLIPIGDKPIIEIIIKEFKRQGINEYYITLNHKSEMVESYFNGVVKDYEIKCIKEKDFLGTAGGAKANRKDNK